jgi:hypothetical protein
MHRMGGGLGEPWRGPIDSQAFGRVQCSFLRLGSTAAPHRPFALFI